MYEHTNTCAPAQNTCPITSNLGLAMKIAGKFQRTYGAFANIIDFREEAALALVEACPKFDSSRGTAFSTFAFSRIEGHLLNQVNKILRTAKRQPTWTRGGGGEITESSLDEGKSNMELGSFGRTPNCCGFESVVKAQFVRKLREDLPKKAAVAEYVLAGFDTKEIAKIINITPARVTQIKGELLKTSF